MVDFIDAFVLEAVVEGLGPRSDRERRVLRAYVQGIACGYVTTGIA